MRRDSADGRVDIIRQALVAGAGEAGRFRAERRTSPGERDARYTAESR